MSEMSPWTTTRILILGTTYPSYSRKYVENACTGGLLEGSSRMVRIHPVPHRYLEEGHRFKKFQWIAARVTKHDSDPRPDSLRIDPTSIELGSQIPATKADERRRLIEASPHLCRSVEELKERWEKDRTSLGTIRPKEITGTRLVPKPASDREDWLQQERELFSQQRLAFDPPPKPLDFVDVEFRVSWVCSDSRCTGHDMGIMQWGLHELYRKYRAEPDGKAKVLARLREELDMTKRDVFFFLGNFRGTMWNFGLMDSFSPGRSLQMKLFEGT